jgi:hypothetical protein
MDFSPNKAQYGKIEEFSCVLCAYCGSFLFACELAKQMYNQETALMNSLRERLELLREC